MPSKAQLEVRGRTLAKSIQEIHAREDLSDAQQQEMLDNLKGEYEAHIKAVENCEEASKMAERLGPVMADAEVKEAGPVLRVPNLKQSRSALAKSLLTHPDFKEITDFKKGSSKFDKAFDISLKDTSEAGNLMGDLVFGGSGPAAIGQNPFGSGAFAPGILPEFLPGIVEKLLYELTLADVISSRPATSPNISYLQESVNTMQANQVAEGAVYPFSSNQFSRVYAEIGKIANAMDITDEGLRDAPELFNFVQNRLLEGVRRQEEVQILAGGGYPGVAGLLGFASSFTASSSGSVFGATSATGTNVAFPPAGTNGAGSVSQTISSLAYGRKVTGPTGSGFYPTAQVVGENLMDAFVDIQLAVFQNPNVVFMNPRDWEMLRFAKDANDQYFGGSFFGSNYGYGATTGKNIWDVPVITSPLQPRYTILTGWFDASTIQTARRDGISMQMTNANGTNFIDGIVTVRAEERLGLLVYRPAAFQLIQLATG